MQTNSQAKVFHLIDNSLNIIQICTNIKYNNKYPTPKRKKNRQNLFHVAIIFERTTNRKYFAGTHEIHCIHNTKSNQRLNSKTTVFILYYTYINTMYIII